LNISPARKKHRCRCAPTHARYPEVDELLPLRTSEHTYQSGQEVDASVSYLDTSFNVHSTITQH
jgi:hypothetical protein